MEDAEGYRVQFYLKAKAYTLSDRESGWYYWDTESTSKTMRIASYSSSSGLYDAFIKVKVRAYRTSKTGEKLFGKWSKTIVTKYK